MTKDEEFAIKSAIADALIPRMDLTAVAIYDIIEETMAALNASIAKHSNIPGPDMDALEAARRIV